MNISKDFRFPLSVAFDGERRATVSAPGFEPIAVAVPEEFHGPGDEWSPEHLLVASAASCYAVTFAAIAERRGIPVHALSVSATGHVARRDDGRTGFVAIELTPRIQTDEDSVAAAERTARAAHTACLVTAALSVPVEVTPIVRALEPVPVG